MRFLIQFGLSWQLRGFKRLSNLDCLFPATNIINSYRFLTEECGYIVQQASQILSACVGAMLAYHSVLTAHDNANVKLILLCQIKIMIEYMLLYL